MKLINSKDIRDYAEASVETYYAIIEDDQRIGGLSRTKENAIEIMQENIEFLCCQSMAELAKHYLLQLRGENVLPVSMQIKYCERIIDQFEKIKSDAGISTVENEPRLKDFR